MKGKNKQTGSIKKQVKRMLIFMSVLFVFLCLLINGSMQRVLLSNSNEYTTITAQKLENQLNLLYDKMESFSLGIANEEAVQQLMSVDFPHKTSYVKPVEEMVAYYKILDQSIVDISFVNDEMYYTTVYDHENLMELRQKNSNSMFSWLGVQKSSFTAYAERTAMLLYGREIIDNGKNVGTLIISINPSFFQINGSEEMNSYFILVDKQGVLFSFNSSEDIASHIWEAWLEESQKTEIIGNREQPFFIQSVYSEEMECWQLSALDIRNTNRNMGTMRNLIWGSVVLVVAFMIFLFGLINVEVVKPLHSFHGVIQQIRSHHKRGWKEGLHLSGCSEIREIGDEFSGMLTDMEQLNRKIFDTATDLYEMKLQKQQAELSYMRSQIDPHFLYNTLEAFRKMALEKNAPEIAQMAVDMGNIFRYSTKGDDVVALEVEISIIKSYIRIQKNRFQGKIEVFYFLPEATMKIKIMKMLLQPVVENAIYHGLEPKDGNGNLYIGARVENETLIITIKDDGVGIEENRLIEIEQELEAEKYDTSKHVGILNTQARIRLQYGNTYGLTVESRQEDGTTITLKVPVIKV